MIPASARRQCRQKLFLLLISSCHAFRLPISLGATRSIVFDAVLYKIALKKIGNTGLGDRKLAAT